PPRHLVAHADQIGRLHRRWTRRGLRPRDGALTLAARRGRHWTFDGENAELVLGEARLAQHVQPRRRHAVVAVEVQRVLPDLDAAEGARIGVLRRQLAVDVDVADHEAAEA